MPAKHALPYKMLAGVTHCPAGWLVLTAKLQAVTILVEDIFVIPTLADVLDYRPSFTIIALNAPVGFLDEPRSDGRGADREAARVLGWPRRIGIMPAPSRAGLAAKSFKEAAKIDTSLQGKAGPLTYRNYRWLREVDVEMQPYRQRTVYSCHPELCFYLLNQDKPLQYSPHWAVGYEERVDILAEKFPGIRQILEKEVEGAMRKHFTDASAVLWSARRIAGKVVTRLPQDPEWDSTGLRMELVR